MKERLKELKRKKSYVECELNAIADEIKKLENQISDSDKNLYKGKWYYKEEDWWDEYDAQQKSYEIVYIEDVKTKYGYTSLSVVIIKFDRYWRLQNFNIEIDEDFPIGNLKDMDEMTGCEYCDLDETIGQLLKCLLEIRPSLKENKK